MEKKSFVSLLASGALKERCCEETAIKCGNCGEQGSAQEEWAGNGNRCPVCDESAPTHLCARCGGQLETMALGGEHPCRSVQRYHESGVVAFGAEAEATQRAVQEEQNRRRVAELAERDAEQRRSEAAARERAEAERRREAAERSAREAERRREEAERSAREAERRREEVERSAREAERRREEVERSAREAERRREEAERSAEEAESRLSEAQRPEDHQILPPPAHDKPKSGIGKALFVASLIAALLGYGYRAVREESDSADKTAASSQASAASRPSQGANTAAANGSPERVAASAPKQAAVGLAKNAKDDPAVAAPAASAPSSSIHQESALTTANAQALALVRRLSIAGLRGNDSEIDSMRASLEGVSKPPRGDRKAARKLLEEGLAQFRLMNFQQSADVLGKAYDLDPLDVQIVNDYGFALLKSGRLADAERILSNALAIAPTRSAAWFNLGELYAQTDDRQRAVGAYLNAWRFSGNRAKTEEFLIAQSENDTRENVRSAAADALRAIPKATSRVEATESPQTASLGRIRSKAESGDVEAQLALGGALLLGKQGVAQNAGEAFFWLSKAAQQGSPHAQYVVARMYQEGVGTPPDEKLAAVWLKRSAEAGFPEGMLGMGDAYSRGLMGFPQSHKNALVWYTKAAELGSVAGQKVLGFMYAKGVGVEADPRVARYWYEMAAAQGDSSARRLLGEL